MHSTKHIQKNLIERYSEQDELEAETSAGPRGGERNPERLRQFFKTAEHRKRQILERMLMD